MRGRAERGATLVEYVLIVAAVVGLGLLAVRFLTSEGSAEVASQADCVSTRPPPPSCQRPILTTTTSVVTPSTSTTVAPTTTTTAAPTTTTSTTAPASTTTTAAPTTTTTAPARQWQGTANFDNNVTRTYSGNGTNGTWYFRVPVNLNDAQGFNDRNVVVEVRYTITDPANGGTGVVTCNTDNNGSCNLRVPGGSSSFSANVRSVQIEFVTIDGMRPPNGADVDTVSKT